jgi:hypothetical protein
MSAAGALPRQLDDMGKGARVELLRNYLEYGASGGKRLEEDRW